MIKISVIMSVYNGEKYLNESIDGVLNQTYEDFEFIIINDGSTDRSRSIIESYKDKRIILVNQNNIGLSKSLNKGIKLAKGEYIARIDADDVCYPFRFEKQAKILDDHNDYVAVGSNADIIDALGNFLYTTNKPVKWEIIKKNIVMGKNPFIHSSVIFRKEIAYRCGLYNEKINQYFEDLLLWSCFINYGKLVNLEESMIKYRLVPNSISIDTSLDRTGYKLYKKLLNNDNITESLISKFILKKRRKKKHKRYYYYITIAKIYLFKKSDKAMFIKNIKLAFKEMPFSVMLLLLILLNMLPQKIINKIYKLFRRIKHYFLTVVL